MGPYTVTVSGSGAVLVKCGVLVAVDIVVLDSISVLGICYRVLEVEDGDAIVVVVLAGAAPTYGNPVTFTSIRRRWWWTI